MVVCIYLSVNGHYIVVWILLVNDTDKVLIIILTINGSDIVVWINLFVNGTSYIGKDEFNCKVVRIKFTSEWYRYSGENNFTMNGPDTVVGVKSNCKWVRYQD